MTNKTLIDETDEVERCDEARGAIPGKSKDDMETSDALCTMGESGSSGGGGASGELNDDTETKEEEGSGVEGGGDRNGGAG